MVRVAIDVTPLIGERTGVGVFTAGVVQGLAATAGCGLRGFAVTWRGRAELAAQLPPGVGLVRLPMAARPLRELWERLDAPVIEWWTGPVDVVHGTNYVVPPALRAAEVVSVHDASFVRFPAWCHPATLHYPTLIRRALRRGAWVHVLSRAMADEIAECFDAPRERIRVVAPGIWPAPPTPAGPAGRAPAGVGLPPGVGLSPPLPAAPARAGPPAGRGGGRRYVLSLGRSEPRKDLPLLVAAFDEVAEGHPDLDLVIAGPAGWDEAPLRAAIAGAHHRDRIQRLGWVADGDKAALLAGATVFAYPSVYEGFGIPPLEAMAAGVPVVAAAAGGVPEAVGSAAVLVPVGDRDALAAGLVRLVEDEGLRGTLVAEGYRQVARFSGQRCTDGLMTLYQEAAAARPNRATR